MKVYQTSEIRNIALIGGAYCGKTTLSEAMLFHGGVINRRGSVEDKNTVSDYREIELERGNSIYSTVLYAEHAGVKINIIDCPGLDDFIGEVVTSLRVADTALMVLNAQSGVDVGAEIQWRWVKKANKPVVFVVNQLDHDKANFDETLRQLKHNFGNNVTVIQYPINAGVGFDSVIDVLKMKMIQFPANGGKAVVSDIPANEKDKAEELHNILIENAAENDEALMEKFFEEGTLSEEEVKQGLRMGIRDSSVFPVMCIAAKTDQGVTTLMDFIKDICPVPHEMPYEKTKDGKELKYDSKEAPSAFVFKTTTEQHLGEVSFMKIYNGEFTEAMDAVNAVNSSKERISQLLSIAGKNREKIEKACAGDIVASIKLKNVSSQHTLNSTKNANDIILPTVLPEPKFRTAIKAKNSSDDEKLGAILAELRKSDLTLLVEQSKELKQTIVSGQGEQHLNINRWIIEKLNKIEVDFISPKIPYRETITKSAEAMYRHKKQSGGAGQFGEVHMLIEPYYDGMPNQTKYPIRGTDTHELAWGGKLVFNNCIVGGAIDARFMPAILKGIMEKMEEGPLTGSYARDICVNIYDGKMHPVDSNEMAFKLAGRNAFREAFKNAGARILEPIYDVEVFVPSENMGSVMTDLQGRRAVVMGMDSEGNYQKIRAKVPLAEMNKYSTSLSSLTSGRASYGMKFSDYQQVPAEVQSALLKAYEESQTEED
ncbi:MAG: elongation factor G [Bacteroidales bacterium]|jgi:elongation factor G|nr:elongation factor G [Bacteroidales bacterium]